MRGVNMQEIQNDLKVKTIATDLEIKNILISSGIENIGKMAEELKDAIYDVGGEIGFTLDNINAAYARIDRIINSIKNDAKDNISKEFLDDDLEIVDFNEFPTISSGVSKELFNDESFNPLIVGGARIFEDKVNSKWDRISENNNLKKSFYRYRLKKKINKFLNRFGFRNEFLSLEKENVQFSNAIQDVFLYANNLDEESIENSMQRIVDLKQKYHANSNEKEKSITLYNHKI
jgi:hypothetical protein